MKLKCLNANCEHQCIIETTNTEMPNTCPWCDAGLELFEIVDEEQEQRTESTLPDWCKVGGLVWSNNSYHKITWIETNGYSIPVIILSDGNTYTFGSLSWDAVSQARLRPYNAEELKALVGKVIETDVFARLVIMYDGRDDAILAGDGDWISENELLNEYTIDGHPCGVFEHLENGEWVE